MPDCRNLQTLDRRGEVEEDEKKVMGQRRRGRGEGRSGEDVPGF